MSSSKPQLPILFFLLLLLFLLSSLAASQEFTYKGFAGGGGGNSPNLTLNGITEVWPNGLLRLTNETSRLLGHAFYPTPLRFLDGNGTAVSFSTQFAVTVVPEFAQLGGHGFAFVVCPDPSLPGALPSQYLGLFSAADDGNATNHVFAVEFDTVQDFEFGDINGNHVGVDLNSLVSNKSASADPINLKAGDTVAWIDYDGVAKLLNISIANATTNSSTKPAKPLISFPVDLSGIFRDQMYVGFSASTGLLASSHYVRGWSFRLGGGAAPALDVASLPTLPRVKTGKNRTSLILAAAFSAFVAAVVLAGAAAYGAYRYKNRDIIEPWELDYGPHRFKYGELRRATRGFRERELLGSGGFGKVYRGVLPGSGETVAVKRVSHESRQGHREFVAEIASIGRLRHRNLVQLQGWCRRRGDLLLVYDYMPNGSLDRHLFGDDHFKGSRLTWPLRRRILRDVASALLYLHEGWESVVLHRDVKASNVLLDADMSARLGDFGLAKLHERGANPSTTRVVGTLGYLAPELTRTGKATTAVDVFAFGAVVLEVVAGRRPIEPRAPPEELVLAEWAWERYAAGEVEKVVDPRLVVSGDGGYDAAEVAAAVKVGLWCSHPSPAMRPTMREVVRYLEGGGENGGEVVPEPPPPPPMPPACSGEVGFDDFVHSYPSSSFERAAAAGGGWDAGTQTSVATFPFSPLSMRSTFVSM
ncbi:hypothetical protein HU200_003413 [Digitaria exilis]|uniref:non-specific serine/threonine protein kinase n=1 Tax=Digitaria exilis TaxID=1010633 RepID=A0A835FY65_9POAL|nr:hypothetical protein HU200_003413 [Digitaria exilis]